MSVIGLLPFYKVGTNDRFKRFSGKACEAPKRQKFLQVSPSEASFSEYFQVIQNYSHALCYVKNETTSVFNGKEEKRIDNKKILIKFINYLSQII